MTEFKTHQWELFLYSPAGEDLTKWIEKVVFLLDQSFESPKRVYYKEPYLLSEGGYGEFEAQIEIHPHGNVIPFYLTHWISFPKDTSTKPSLIVRKQEAVVFRNPPPLLYEGLTQASFTWNRFKKIKKQPKPHDAEVSVNPASDYTLDEKWLKEVSEVSQKIRVAIHDLKIQHHQRINKINVLIEQIRKIDPDIAEAASLFL